ncbi:MAG: alpha/beta hydrolase-fold protein [Planctomycetota bacterium]|nr:alpha/beta hydrolase-fold protein [Planctomycetota bacterium]
MLRYVAIAVVAGMVLAGPGLAQPPGRQRPPEFESVRVAGDRKITFKVLAPKATSVKLSAGDIPGNNQGADLKKDDRGVWEVTVGPVPPGAYRYHFNMDGVAVVDPKNPATSESNQNTWSLVTVPGDFSAWKDVPHGAVAQITYPSKTLEKARRAHVYTPPGYEKSRDSYPVFYLLHGASDSDNSWSTVGRAGVILDNLIAAGKARPMIVVMPAGHTGVFQWGGGGKPFDKQMEEFGDDFSRDLRPLVEKTYRVKGGRANRAIAGLSMGGAQALNVAFSKLADYGYVGVFSSGVFGIVGGGAGNAQPNRQWEESRKADLDNAELKKGLKLVWFGCGEKDFLIETSRGTVKMLKSHGFEVVNHETGGGHTWDKWREYLNDFAPQLFAE